MSEWRPTQESEPVTAPVRCDADVVRVRQLIRALAVELGFGLVDQTKIVTAASEIARNTVIYGGGGELRVDRVAKDGKVGLALTFEDRGPGIADIQEALRDGFTSASGLGLGLGGSRRLCDEFEIHSEPGVGTRVRMVRWKL